MTLPRKAVLCLLLVAGTAGCRPADAVAPIALIGATLIDGSGGPPIPDAVIIVRGTLIEAAGPRGEVQVPRGAVEVELAGHWIIPGLIDGNAAAESWALPRYVAYGVTTIRDPRSRTSEVMELAEQANLNAILSPRIFLSGTPIGNAADDPIGSANEARRAVDDLSLAGVDFIAVGALISSGVLEALVEEAGSFRLPVSARPGLTDAFSAAEAGVSVIDLLGGIPQAASGNAAPYYSAYRQGVDAGWAFEERNWTRLLPAALDRLAAQLVEREVAMVPALVYHETMSNLDDRSLLPSPEPGAVPEEIGGGWVGEEVMRARGWTDGDLREFRRARPVQDRFIGTFLAEGGRLVAGSASGGPFLVPGASLHQELELLAKAGLTAAQALNGATAAAADLMAADSLGRIGPGKSADLVVLRSDPLADIGNVGAIERVMLRGVLMAPDSLKASW